MVRLIIESVQLIRPAHCTECDLTFKQALCYVSVSCPALLEKMVLLSRHCTYPCMVYMWAFLVSARTLDYESWFLLL